MPARAKPQPLRTGFLRPEDPVPAGVKVLWRPHDGPQTEALLREEDEVLYGGAKGGGKTACGIAWLIRGNHHMPIDPADHSYINHAHYRALVLRKNMVDLGDWIDKARRIYEPLGATFRERPLPLFEFRSGAKIVLGHLDDSDTYTKYAGQEFQRFLLEEATLVPDLKSYLMVRSCIRSVHRELHSQTFLTANPGGPGHAWVRDRFIKAKDATGNAIPEGTVITDKDTGETRIFIPAKLRDNPALMADPGYARKLMALPEAERRAFLDGDWDALSGVYFTEFRPNGPLTGEPPEASHVIPPTPLQPWLHRMAAMDWGYAHDGACYWGCENLDRRFHIYREMVAKTRSAEQWGVEIALASLEDLKGIEGGVMSLYLSPDAWDKRNDQRTIADQIAAGIKHVLGQDSVLLQAGDDDGDGGWLQKMEERRAFGISIRKAPNQRVAGAQYIRSQLRWWKLSKVETQTFDTDLFVKLLRADSKRAMDYRDAIERQQQAEILPGLLIHSCCQRLIDTLQGMLYDPKNTEDVAKIDGDDSYDAFRYLVFARSKARAREPLSIMMQRRMESIAAGQGVQELDGNTKVWVARKAEADYAGVQTLSDPFYIPRLGSRRAKVGCVN